MAALIYLFVERVINVFEILLIVYALLSWFPGAYDNFLGRTLKQIVDPILAPIRRLNLVFAGIDFTVLVVILLMDLFLRVLAMLLSLFMF